MKIIYKKRYGIDINFFTPFWIKVTFINYKKNYLNMIAVGIIKTMGIPKPYFTLGIGYRLSDYDQCQIQFKYPNRKIGSV